jgi:hypothetical protein
MPHFTGTALQKTRMITYFSDKQMAFAQAISAVEAEIASTPYMRTFYSPITLAIVGSLIDFRSASASQTGFPPMSASGNVPDRGIRSRRVGDVQL